MKRIISLLTLVIALGSVTRAADVAFITNPQGGDAALSAGDLKAVLLGNKTKWNSGGLVKLAVLESGPLHEQVVQDNTQRSADQFDKFWKKLVFTGKGVPPATAADEAAMLDYVAKTPGALGYVSAGAVTDKVKVLEIQ